ncbi:MAG: SDR family NAD(P)-dependent oxidoreductase [Myxococcota bacterium]
MHIVITGGHSGIGLELAKRVAADGHRLGLVVRDPSRLEGVPDAIKSSSGFTYWSADLAIADDVTKVAEVIHADWGHVDVLFNNAGVLLPELRYSAAGREMHLEVNTLAPMHLMRGLAHALRAADTPTVVNTVTGSMHSTTLELEQLTHPTTYRKLFGQYLQSKLALTLWMNAVAKEPDWEGVAIRSVNPGANKTTMTSSEGVPWPIRMLRGVLFRAPTKGGNLLYDAAFDPAHGRESGVFFDEKRVREATTLPDTARATLEELLGAS